MAGALHAEALYLMSAPASLRDPCRSTSLGCFECLVYLGLHTRMTPLAGVAALIATPRLYLLEAGGAQSC